MTVLRHWASALLQPAQVALPSATTASPVATALRRSAAGRTPTATASSIRTRLRSRVTPTRAPLAAERRPRSEEHTSELQSLMRISYAVFCLKKKKKQLQKTKHALHTTTNVTKTQ